jgi:hypothetical protein
MGVGIGLLLVATVIYQLTPIYAIYAICAMPLVPVALVVIHLTRSSSAPTE